MTHKNERSLNRQAFGSQSKKENPFALTHAFSSLLTDTRVHGHECKELDGLLGLYEVWKPERKTLLNVGIIKLILLVD